MEKGKINNNKCAFPVSKEEEHCMCNEESEMSVALPLINRLEDGRIEASASGSIVVPLCRYHSMLAMMSGMVGAKSDDKMKHVKITAPFDMIQLVESVVNATIITGKLEEMLESNKKAKEMAEKIQKEIGAKK